MYHKLHPSLGIFIYLGFGRGIGNFLDVRKPKPFRFVKISTDPIPGTCSNIKWMDNDVQNCNL